MRRLLDAVYDAAGYLAALFLVGTLAMVLLGIGGRVFHFHVRGTDAYAGYSMAASGFLALAYTLRRGEHIRVSLLLQAVGAGANRALEIWAHLAGTVLAGLFAFFSVRLAWQSWQFNDISTATDATPLWIPQIAMALGTTLLALALLDALAGVIRGTARASAGEAAPRRTE